MTGSWLGVLLLVLARRTAATAVLLYCTVDTNTVSLL